MIFIKNKAIDDIKAKFVRSNSFDDFKAIMEDLSLMKFSEIQASKKKPYEEMCVDKAILNIYMNLSTLLEYNVKNKEELSKKG